MFDEQLDVLYYLEDIYNLEIRNLNQAIKIFYFCFTIKKIFFLANN